MGYTRNYNPNYFEECEGSTNCGSFAFNIEEWYSPDKYFEEDFYCCVDEWIDHCIRNGWDEQGISNAFVDILVKYILLDFDDIRIVSYAADVKSNEELIAFRTFVNSEGNWDFHFKVLRDYVWLEKCGSKPVRFCEKDDWHNGFIEYNSPTVYFARKLEN